MDSAPRTAVEAVPKKYFASTCLWNTCIYKQTTKDTRKHSEAGSCQIYTTFPAQRSLGLQVYGSLSSIIASWLSRWDVVRSGKSFVMERRIYCNAQRERRSRPYMKFSWRCLVESAIRQVSLGQSHETLQLQNIQLKYVEAIASQTLMIGGPVGFLEVEGIIQKSHGYGAKLSLCWRLPPTPWRCAEAAVSHCAFEQWLFTAIRWEWQRPRQRT